MTKQKKAAEKKSDLKIKSEDVKKNTSLRLDKKTLKALKMIAIEQDTSVQKLIESLIVDYINKHS
jgi:predicted DNA-binding ribbon-helix-helix protein